MTTTERPPPLWKTGHPTEPGRYFLATLAQGGVYSYETAEVFDGYHPRHLKAAAAPPHNGDLVSYLGSLEGDDLADARAPYLSANYLESGRRNEPLKGSWVVAYCPATMPPYDALPEDSP